MKKIYFSLVAFCCLTFLKAQIVNIPDANFKTRLLQASSSNNFASTQSPNSLGSVTSYNTIDTNGDGEIQVSEASAIKFLRINSSSIVSIEGISSFVNLEYFNCTYNQIQSIDVTALTNLRFLDCFNNQLSNLNVNGLTNLLELWCSFNQLTTIDVSSLTNLQELVCTNNQIASINVSGLASMTRLSCESNQITALNTTGATSIITLTCSNNLLSTYDPSGLINLDYFDCSNNLLTSLNLTSLGNANFLICSNNQLSSIDLSNMSSLSVFRCNSNQITNINCSGLTQNMSVFNCSTNQLSNLNLTGLRITELDCSNNQLSVLNLSGLRITRLFCSNNQLSSIDVNEMNFMTHLNCSSNQLVNLFIKNNNSTWTTLDFQGNPNLVYVCADESDTTLVQQKITQYGLTNCNLNSYCNFNPGGTYYVIQGVSRFDGNANGCDVSDSVYPNLRLNMSLSVGNIISNTTGDYYLTVPSGSYFISPQLENPTYFNISPSSASVTFPTAASPFVRNFCITPNGVHHDLEVVIIPIGIARPGFDAQYKLKYKNKGNVAENVSVSFNYNDSILDFVSASATPTSQISGSLSWSLGTVNPLQSGEIIITLNLNAPTENPAVNSGDILNYTSTISGLNTDEFSSDNNFTLNQVVVNSFDPNDKTCLEGVVISPTLIGQYVHYRIRFENTGTFAAQNVVVRDIIDTAKFDLSTLQITDASHSCVTRIINTNRVEFIFENINLPFDDANNDGYVVFKIKTKSNLVVGNTISNSANIYFDYNFPITTNTATSAFQVLNNDSFESDAYFSIYPNPVKDILNLTSKRDNQITSLTIFNLLGQQLLTVIKPEDKVDVSNLQVGSYIVKVNTNTGVFSGKFIKE